MDRYIIPNIFILLVIISSVAADLSISREEEREILQLQKLICPPIGEINEFELTTLYTTTKMFGCAYLGLDKPSSPIPLFHLWVEDPQIVLDNTRDIRGSCRRKHQMDHFMFRCMTRFIPTDRVEYQNNWRYTSLLEYTAANQYVTKKKTYRCADVADNNIYLNHKNTSDKIFHCIICGKSFVLNYLLKNHLEEHRRQVQYKTNKCNFCGKQFMSKFGLNRHIENHHTLANEPHDLMAEQFPINTANKNIVSIVRDTSYFCVKKLSNIKNGLCNDDYDETSQNKHIFKCRICKYSPTTDIHSFALHISDHGELNMHECIVCDKTFNSVVLWKAHMTYHQQQSLNLLESQSNTFDTNNENIKFEPNVIQNSVSIEENNTDSGTMSRNHKKETKSPSIKKANLCNLCNRKFKKRCYFTNHMMMKHNINTNTPKQLTSIDCKESIILSPNIESINEDKDKLSVPVNNIRKENIMKYICKICKMKFADNIKLQKHTKLHILNMLKCNDCGQQYETNLALDNHIWENHSDNISTSNKN